MLHSTFVTVFALASVFISQSTFAQNLTDTELTDLFSAPADNLDFDKAIAAYHSADEAGQEAVVKYWVRMHLPVELGREPFSTQESESSTPAVLVKKNELLLLHRLLNEGVFMNDARPDLLKTLFKDGVPDGKIIRQDKLEDLVKLLYSPTITGSSKLKPEQISENNQVQAFVEHALTSSSIIRRQNERFSELDKLCYHTKLFKFLDGSYSHNYLFFKLLHNIFNGNRLLGMFIDKLYTDDEFALVQLTKAVSQCPSSKLYASLNLVFKSEDAGLEQLRKNITFRDDLVKLLGVEEYRNLARTFKLADLSSYENAITPQTDAGLLKFLAKHFVNESTKVFKLFAKSYIEREPNVVAVIDFAAEVLKAHCLDSEEFGDFACRRLKVLLPDMKDEICAQIVAQISSPYDGRRSQEQFRQIFLKEMQGLPGIPAHGDSSLTSWGFIIEISLLSLLLIGTYTARKKSVENKQSV